jgi:hypothetical protein
MDSIQIILDLALGLTAFFGAFILNNISKSISNLQRRDSDLTKEVHAIHILIAGDYVKRIEMQKMFSELASTLSRIEEKLDKKQDKNAHNT